MKKNSKSDKDIKEITDITIHFINGQSYEFKDVENVLNYNNIFTFFSDGMFYTVPYNQVMFMKMVAESEDETK